MIISYLSWISILLIIVKQLENWCSKQVYLNHKHCLNSNQTISNQSYALYQLCNTSCMCELLHLEFQFWSVRHCTLKVDFIKLSESWLILWTSENRGGTYQIKIANDIDTNSCRVELVNIMRLILISKCIKLSLACQCSVVLNQVYSKGISWQQTQNKWCQSCSSAGVMNQSVYTVRSQGLALIQHFLSIYHWKVYRDRRPPGQGDLTASC